MIMLQGHTFHSLLRQDLRTSSTFVLSDFVGGMPSAIFLFLTGVTLAFLMDSRERQGATAGQRVVASLRRAGYILGLAFLVRLQLWLFGLPGSPWTDLLRVDVLNCMGVALGVLSVMAVFRTVERVRLCAVLGVAVAAASPLVSQLDWSGVHPLVRAYIAPDYASFGFFPWGAFVAFGVSLGSLIRIASHEELERAMQWLAVIGCALIVVSQRLSDLPSLYGKSEFWLNSPFMILIKTGVILLIVAFAFLWNKHTADIVELGAAVRRQFFAGLLGAYRADLRPLAGLLAHESEPRPVCRGSRPHDRLHGAAVIGANAPGAGPGVLRISAATTGAGPGFGRLATFSVRCAR